MELIVRELSADERLAEAIHGLLCSPCYCPKGNCEACAAGKDNVQDLIETDPDTLIELINEVIS